MSLLAGKRVVIVEDTTIAATYLAREITNMGAEVVGLARSEEQALSLVEKGKPALILMDINLSDGGSGIEAAKLILKKHNIPIIYTTSYSDDATLTRALETSPYGYIVKPFDSKIIRTACETALHRFALELQVTESEKRFRVASEAAQFGVVALKESGKAFDFQGASSLQNRLGAGTSMPVSDFMALFPESMRNEIAESIQRGETVRKTIKVEGQSLGEEALWLDVVFSDVSMDNERVKIGAVIDVTERQRKMRKLKLSTIILDQLAEGVAVLDKHGMIRDVNKALCRLFGVAASALVGASLSEFGIRRDELLDATVGGRSGVPNRQKRTLLTARGEAFPALVTLSELEELHGDLRFVMTVSDISELAHAEKRLESLAYTDQLTGAGNRNYLKLALNESMEADKLKALIFIDIDGFKLVNDTYGHDVGDQLLAKCAQSFQSELSDDDIFIRHGGDEFVILVQNEIDVNTLSERLLKALDTPMISDNAVLKMSASIGTVTYEQNQDVNELLKQADIAMYEAKKRGKNQAVAYSKEQNEAIEYRLYVEQGLYNALLNKELHATFQPIVDTQQKVVALEALCRWHSQDIGDINPASFIPVAEETGLINALGLKMLREVCIAHSLLSESGFGHIKLHVNVSILQLNSSELVKEFLDYLADFSVSTDDIVLEVTESAMHDVTTRNVLKTLSEAGFGIAIDDFGAGYASVSELAQPFTTVVKLDKSLAPSQDETSQRNIIAESLVQLCRKLNKKVLFEGIESKAQADFATEAGCHYMQGFLFARPMSIMEVINMLRDAEPETVPASK
ncbi:EAL domain-containing protein [Alteromonas sp. H39]|uniref:two-component system response regulator n=1 Tax=Alteromonas sp. H39 TaxID=3389876 RepID=UPI0039DFC7EE